MKIHMNVYFGRNWTSFYYRVLNDINYGDSYKIKHSKSMKIESNEPNGGSMRVWKGKLFEFLVGLLPIKF